MTRTHRTEQSILDDLFEFMVAAPVWAGPVVALIAYVVSRWIFPWLLSLMVGDEALGGSAVQVTKSLGEQLAPFLAGLVIVIWLVALITKWSDRRRIEQQTGLKSIESLSWQEFELLLCEAFRRQGFSVEHSGACGPDGGIDVRLSKAGAVTLVQCKHWKQRQVGVRTVRELMGVVSSEGAQAGIVVCSGRFTQEAITFADRNPIRLINGSELVVMLGEVQRSGRIRNAESAAYETAPGPDAKAARVELNANLAAEACPRCGAEMVHRVARRGKHAGSEFLGCSRYPHCRGTRDLDVSMSEARR